MKLAKIFSPVVSMILLSACISSAPIVPVTPANQSQIAVCQSDATLHNSVVIGDFIIGGITSGLAAVSAGLPGTDANAKTGLAISAAAVGALTVTGAAVAGFTAANFVNSNCSTVVGALPSGAFTPAPAPAPTATPLVTPMSVVITPPVPPSTPAPVLTTTPVVVPVAVPVSTPAPVSTPVAPASKTPAPKK